MIFLGVVFSLIQGAALPVWTVLMGDIIDIFSTVKMRQRGERETKGGWRETKGE